MQFVRLIIIKNWLAQPGKEKKKKTFQNLMLHEILYGWSLFKLHDTGPQGGTRNVC